MKQNSAKPNCSWVLTLLISTKSLMQCWIIRKKWNNSSIMFGVKSFKSQSPSTSFSYCCVCCQKYSRSTWPSPCVLLWRRSQSLPPDCGSLCLWSLPWYLACRAWPLDDLKSKHPSKHLIHHRPEHVFWSVCGYYWCS